MKRVLVTGGAGYVGCVLVRRLLDIGHQVVVYDQMLYGRDGLPVHSRLQTVEGDIRDVTHLGAALRGVQQVVHLACISNDPSFELDPALSKSINYDCFEPMVAACKQAGVERFIYASTSSVYGVSAAPEVTEEHPLVPLTDYNKYKGMCEPILERHRSPKFTTVTIRPATVCGYSPRMRLDLTVNILTNLAIQRRQITVCGGRQQRPNIHIDDLCELYTLLLEAPKERITGQIFNAGYQNYTVAEIAQMVKEVVEQEMPQLAPIEVVTSPSNDLRSYHISSAKIARVLGYRPKRSIQDAVRDLCAAFRAGYIANSLVDDRYFNVKRLIRTRAA